MRSLLRASPLPPRRKPTKRYQAVYMILGQRHNHPETTTNYRKACDLAEDYRAKKFWAFVERVR